MDRIELIFADPGRMKALFFSIPKIDLFFIRPDFVLQRMMDLREEMVRHVKKSLPCLLEYSILIKEKISREY